MPNQDIISNVSESSDETHNEESNSISVTVKHHQHTLDGKLKLVCRNIIQF